MAVDPQESRWAQVGEQCDEILADRHLILASNRGPVEHHTTPDGRTEARRGSGGVVTALSSLAQMVEFTWVASAIGEGDRKVSEECSGARIRSPLPGHRIYLRFVVTPRRVYHKYYNVLCNPLLWFLQHYMWNSPYNPNLDQNVHDAWHDGYVEVNKAFAKAIIEESREGTGSPIVMLHDYHLYLAPEYVRSSLPDAIIHYFTHIPWPTPRYWQLLPSYMISSICKGVCNSDIVGFQTIHDVRNFLDTCEEFLPESEVDHRKREIYWVGRRTQVRAYPISINVAEIRRIANSPRAMDYERKLRTMCNDSTIVRVDRAEPSKNVVRGFKAYGLLLFQASRVPGACQFSGIPGPLTHPHQAVPTVHGRDPAGDQGDQLHLRHRRVAAGVHLYREQLYPGHRRHEALRRHAGELGDRRHEPRGKRGPGGQRSAMGVFDPLGDHWGPHKQLSPGALSVSPSDIEGTMQAMYQALTMGPEERGRRASTLNEIMEREDITHWIHSQLEDIRALV